jgi:predicted transposase/invertase (TIGR01784 family)
MSNKKLIRFDWAMKTLLRDKANFDVLEGFLCALLEDDNVKILNILESETNQKDEDDKFVRVDMLIQDSQERKIYIEIQNTRETDYLESLLYSTSKIIVEHQKLSKDFSNVSKIISISILYFNLGIGEDYIYYGTTNFKGLNTGEHLKIKQREDIPNSLEPKYKMVNKEIFPEYYLITVERYKNIITKRIDEWIYIFKNSEVAQGSTSKNIDKAEQKLAEINMSEEERKRYEKYLVNFMRDKDVLNTARVEGKIEGKEERNEEIAIEMIIEGEINDKIKKYTKLTDEQINELRNRLKNNK